MSKKHEKILYLGLDPSRYPNAKKIIHLPVIKTVPKPFSGYVEECFLKLTSYTHILFTSRTALSIFFKYAKKIESVLNLNQKTYISIGRATSQLLAQYSMEKEFISEQETAEGIIELFLRLEFNKQDHIFFPRSSLGRDLIPKFFKKKGLKHTVLDLYDTLPNQIELPPLQEFTQIVFTSPSTVSAFFALLKQPYPPQEKCFAIGPVTKASLDRHFSEIPSNLNCFENRYRKTQS